MSDHICEGVGSNNIYILIVFQHGSSTKESVHGLKDSAILHHETVGVQE